MLVAHTGQVPLSMRRPLVVTSWGSVITRFVLHLTQYPSWDAVLGDGAAAVCVVVLGTAAGAVSAFFRAAICRPLPHPRLCTRRVSVRYRTGQAPC